MIRSGASKNCIGWYRPTSTAAVPVALMGHLSIPRKDEHRRVVLGNHIVRSNLALRPPNFSSQDTPPPFVCLSPQTRQGKARQREQKKTRKITTRTSSYFSKKLTNECPPETALTQGDGLKTERDGCWLVSTLIRTPVVQPFFFVTETLWCCTVSSRGWRVR